MIKIFVIGNIGSGKSFFCKELASVLNEKLGSTALIDLDKIGHNVFKNKNVQERLHQVFGDFSSRAELAKIAFSSKENKKNLEDIMHSSILNRLNDIFYIEENNDTKFIVVEQTAFSGKSDKCIERADNVICVTTDDSIRLQRCLDRGMSKDDFLQRNSQQLPQSDMIKFADYIIDNNGTEEDLKISINKFIEKFKLLNNLY